MRSWPESFTTQPSGARLPRRIAKPPFGLIASDTGRITSWPSVSSALSAISPSVCPVTVMASSWSRPASLAAGSRAARRRRGRGRWPRSGRPASGRPSSGVPQAMRSKSSSASGTPASCATASRCSTRFVEPPDIAPAAIAFSSASRVMMLARAAGRAASTSMHEPPALRGDRALLAVLGGHHRAARRRDAEHLEGHRHRVRGELAAARAGAGRGVVLEVGRAPRRSGRRRRGRRCPRTRPGSSRPCRASVPGAIEPP